jgi:cytochrome c oxidase subunit 2
MAGSAPRLGSKDLFLVATLWVVLTAVGLFLAFSVDLHPVGASREAGIIDDAFDLLLVLSVPVLTFVLSVLVYSIVRHRGGEGDGPPLRTNRLFVWSWVVLSSALAIFVIFNPGFKGLDELRDFDEPDMTIDVFAAQWNWTYEYQELGLRIEKADELVLPIDSTVRFRVTSTDVLHSFWIPAFRLKVDAVPGQWNETVGTVTVTGAFTDDPAFRVQCAELCGTGHARMQTHVRVVDEDEFAAWAETTLAAVAADG